MTEPMTITLKTLSPVHIGSGVEIAPSEYYYDSKSRQVHRLDLERLTRDPEFADHLEKFVAEASQARQIDRFVPIKILARHILYSLPTSQGPLYPIKAMVKSGGRVLIPGSSIKGSLLSGVLWDLLREKGQQDPQILAKIKTACRDKQGKMFNDLLALGLGEFCGNPEVDRPHENRFLKWLNVSDTDPLPVQGNLKVARVEVVGAKKAKIPMLLEAIREGVSLTFSLWLPPGACRRQPPAWDVAAVLQTADSFYRRVWEKTETTPPPADGWLLRLGQGSGAWATSLLLLATDLHLRQEYGVHPPATKKLADGLRSLGWVLLTPWTPGGQKDAQMEPDVSTPLPPPPPVQETWDQATLTWDPGKQQITAKAGSRTAIGTGKDLVPAGLQKNLLVKKKAVTATVTVEPIGGKNFRLLKIHEQI